MGRRQRARAKGLEFALTVGDVLAAWPKDERCPVCGREFIRGKSEDRCPSIDRIDNAAGYTPANVLVICLGCNGRSRAPRRRSWPSGMTTSARGPERS